VVSFVVTMRNFAQVHRGKLRWAVPQDKASKINVSDIVEIWCCGEHVPGVWLIGQVKKIKHGKYAFEGIRSGCEVMWVPRSRIRPADFPTLFVKQDMRPVDRLNRPERQSLSLRTLSAVGGSCVLS
jgi:hypothetical protein